MRYMLLTLKYLKMKYKLASILLPLCLTVLLISSCSGNREKSVLESNKPNILFIPVDDLRPEFGEYGNDFIRTPNMDKLAEEGVIFTRTYCQKDVCNK